MMPSNSFALAAKVAARRIEDGIEGFEIEQRCYAHSSREHVIGRLAVVHMVVWMDVSVVAQLHSEDFVRSIGDHLVGVHVKADAGAGLEDIDDKFVVPFAVDDLLRRLNDRFCPCMIDQAEIAIGLDCGALHHSKGADKLRMSIQAGDGIIFNGARRLCAVVGARGHFDRAERIFFFARFGHANRVQRTRHSAHGAIGPRHSAEEQVQARIGIPAMRDWIFACHSFGPV